MLDNFEVTICVLCRTYVFLGCAWVIIFFVLHLPENDTTVKQYQNIKTNIAICAQWWCKGKCWSYLYAWESDGCEQKMEYSFHILMSMKKIGYCEAVSFTSPYNYYILWFLFMVYVHHQIFPFLGQPRITNYIQFALIDSLSFFWWWSALSGTDLAFFTLLPEIVPSFSWLLL